MGMLMEISWIWRKNYNDITILLYNRRLASRSRLHCKSNCGQSRGDRILESILGGFCKHSEIYPYGETGKPPGFLIWTILKPSVASRTSLHYRLSSFCVSSEVALLSSYLSLPAGPCISLNHHAQVRTDCFCIPVGGKLGKLEAKSHCMR